jgi:hypothetical protein
MPRTTNVPRTPPTDTDDQDSERSGNAAPRACQMCNGSPSWSLAQFPNKVLFTQSLPPSARIVV